MIYDQSASATVEISLLPSEAATAVSWLISAGESSARDPQGLHGNALAKFDEAEAIAGWLREGVCVTLRTEEALHVLEILTAWLDGDCPEDLPGEHLWKVRLELDRALHAASLPAVDLSKGDAPLPSV